MLRRIAFAAMCLLATPTLAQEAAENFDTELVLLETTAGDIRVEVETERAPITAANFLRYVDEDRFDGIVFYRAMTLDWEQPNGLIQAGVQYDPDRVLDPIPHEPTSDTGVLHTKGALSMARNAPGTATGDFSILLRAQPSMDADPQSEDPDLREGYAAFGRVVDGWDTVLAIHAMPTDPDKGEGWMRGQMLAKPVTIIDARRISAVD